MSPDVIKLLLQLVQIASQLAPIVVQEVQAISAQTGKSAQQILDEAGVTIDDNEQEALAQLTALIAQKDTTT